MKTVFLWRTPSGYFKACTEALVSAGHSVSVFFEQPAASEYVTADYAHLTSVEFWAGTPDFGLTTAFCRDARPDVVVVASWSSASYLRTSAAMRDECLRLVAVDSPWKENRKQQLGRFTHPPLLKRCFDGAWVTGDPQWQLMKRLGFRSDRVIDHLYCCDTGVFQPRGSIDLALTDDAPFLFVGRLVPQKGTHELLEGYRRFRSRTGSERPLHIIGRGDVLIDEGNGVAHTPQVTSAELNGRMAAARALVHVAHREHWGVVIHEAARVGIPIVISRSVGAGSRFFSPGESGFFAEPDPDSIAGRLALVDAMDVDAYKALSNASQTLGSVLDLRSWQENFTNECTRILEGK